MRRELSPYRSVLFRRQPVVRMRDLDDPFFKLFKAIKVTWSGEKTLPNEGEALVVDRPADRRKGGFSNFFFVVEKAQNFVECSRIDGFGNPGETSRPEHSSDFAERLVHRAHRHMVERLKHHHDVEGAVGGRDRLGRPVAETDVGQVAYLKVSRMLEGIDFQRQD